MKFRENQLTVSGLSPFTCQRVVLCCVVALEPMAVVVVLVVLLVQFQYSGVALINSRLPVADLFRFFISEHTSRPAATLHIILLIICNFLR